MLVYRTYTKKIEAQDLFSLSDSTIEYMNFRSYRHLLIIIMPQIRIEIIDPTLNFHMQTIITIRNSMFQT